jgi:hypothetical protein
MKTYKIRSVQEHGQGDITILHSNGAFHYNEKDVTLKEWTNNFFCRFDINRQSNWQVFIFWNWVLSISFGLFFILVGMKYMEIPLSSKHHGEYDLVRVILTYVLYLFPFTVLSYTIFRLIYFFRYRDFFSKHLIYISLKSNQSITLRGKTGHLVEVNKKILPFDKNNRIFEKERKNDNVTKLISEYFFAIIIFSFCFYSIYSSWGNNSISDPNPSYSKYCPEELSEKELSELTKAKSLEYSLNRLKQINEYIEVKNKWDEKYKNEQVSPFYFFSLGYIFPIVLGGAIVIIFALFGLIILFLAYLMFWPFGYYMFKIGVERDLRKVLNKKYFYPLVIFAFITSVCINFILSQNILATFILLLIPILLPILIAIILVLVLGMDGGKGFVKDIKDLVVSIFSRKYWKFLFTGNSSFSSEFSSLNILAMIAIPWLILFYYGWFSYSFNDGTPRTTIEELIFGLICSVVFIRLLYRMISPFGLKYFFSINLSNIKNGRYLSFYKNDFLSISSLVRQNGAKLEFASNRLKDNKDIVEAAVKNNGLSLQFASGELRNDKEIVLEAINQNPKAIEFASIELQNDTDIIEQLNKN